MIKKIVSATEARQKWFELLQLVYFKGASVVIHKNKVPIVRMEPVGSPHIFTAKEVVLKTFGFLADAKRSEWPKENREVKKKKADYLDKLWKK